LSSERREIRRTIYDLLGILEELGGVREILLSIAGIFFYSMGEQSYYLKFMKNVFLV